MRDDRTRTSYQGHPPDVSLLLLAHSEQHLLSREVIPVVRQLETGELPTEQRPAAAAYLEVTWAQALARARATDAALRRLETLERSGLDTPDPGAPPARAGRRREGSRGEGPIPPGQAVSSGPLHPRAPHALPDRARRYHAAVRALREAVSRHVAPFLEGGYLAEPSSAWTR